MSIKTFLERKIYLLTVNTQSNKQNLHYCAFTLQYKLNFECRHFLNLITLLINNLQFALCKHFFIWQPYVVFSSVPFCQNLESDATLLVFSIRETLTAFSVWQKEQRSMLLSLSSSGQSVSHLVLGFQDVDLIIFCVLQMMLKWNVVV